MIRSCAQAWLVGQVVFSQRLLYTPNTHSLARYTSSPASSPRLPQCGVTHTTHKPATRPPHVYSHARYPGIAPPLASVFPCVVVPYFSSSASSTSSRALRRLSLYLPPPSYSSRSHPHSRVPHLLPLSPPSTFPRHSHSSSPHTLVNSFHQPTPSSYDTPSSSSSHSFPSFPTPLQ